MRTILCAAVFVCAMILCTQAGADEALREEMLRLGVDPKRVDAAVDRGVSWLKGKQGGDGSWKGERTPAGDFTDGLTALCGYALVKSGETIDADSVKRALNYLKGKPFRRTYSVATLIMFLSALAIPPPPEKEAEELTRDPDKGMGTTLFDPYEKKKKKQLKKLPNWVKALIQRAVQWLVSKQSRNIWRYPGHCEGAAGPQEDASNTQYAMLALHCASQVGVNAPKSVYPKVVQYFLSNQDQRGPKVKGFPVPAADFKISQLKKLEKEMLERMRQDWDGQVSAWKAAKEQGGPLPKLADPRTTAVVEDPYQRYKAERVKMRARGWGYINRKGAGIINKKWGAEWARSTGSMTTSGIISLVICKSQVEKKLNKKYLKAVNYAIRDGFGWLSKHWTVQKNPNYMVWHLYYLYGVERASVLGLVDKIGEHNWYKEGAEYLMGAQQSNGSWKGEQGQGSGWGAGVGDVANSCFALLFLLRATPPLTKKPVIETGKGLFPGKKR